MGQKGAMMGLPGAKGMMGPQQMMNMQKGGMMGPQQMMGMMGGKGPMGAMPGPMGMGMMRRMMPNVQQPSRPAAAQSGAPAAPGPQVSASGAPGAAPPMPGQTPLTASSLAALVPNAQKQLLGEKLFPAVNKFQPELAGKITGMMPEMDNSELLAILDNEQQLRIKIDEAMRVLDNTRP